MQPSPPRQLQTRIAVAVAVFAAALGAALFVLRDDATDSSTGRGGPDQPAAAASTSDIWEVGDAWTVKVLQDSGAVTPDGAESIATVPFRFAVTGAPKGADGLWTVRVTQDGAEGPFAEGWTLEYTADATGLQLARVAVGSQPPLEAELAAIVLGPQFPYEVRYTEAPVDATIRADRLMDRALLPPDALPGDGGTAATPPATAPPLPGGAPVAPASTQG